MLRTQVSAHGELTERLSSLARRHNGPAYRRNANHLAQDIARARLTPWLQCEAQFAEGEFRKTAQRFVELANPFLHRLGEPDVPGLEQIPQDLCCDQWLSAKSQFHFHIIERVAAPASPLLLISDVLLGGMGLRDGIVRDAHEFLDQLLEVNSSGVQSDVDERLRESRKKLEAEIKGVLRGASAIADRALARARSAQTGGAPAVVAALARLVSIELDVLRMVPSREFSS